MSQPYRALANIDAEHQNHQTIVDFRKPGDSTKIFAQPPLLGSQQSNWSGLQLEYFSNHPGWVTDEHIIANHTIALSLTDSVQSKRWLDGQFQQERLIIGSVAILPAYMAHKCEWYQPVDFLALSIEPNYLGNVVKVGMNPDCIEFIPTFAIQQDTLILEIGLALKAALETGGAFEQLYVESLTTALCVHLLRHYATQSPKVPIHKGGLSRDRLRRTLDFIHASLNQPLQLETLAAQVGLDIYYFCRLFRQSMGVSPYQYVLQQRIEKAKSLLKEDDLSITDIALECGFNDSSHLARYFRKVVGISPKIYRQQM